MICAQSTLKANRRQLLTITKVQCDHNTKKTSRNDSDKGNSKGNATKNQQQIAIDSGVPDAQQVKETEALV